MSGKSGMKHLYSKLLADEICVHIKQGKTLSTICKDVYATLEPYQILAWREKEDFKQKYDEASSARLDLWCEWLVDIVSAPMPLNCQVSEDNGHMAAKTNAAAELGRRRLFIDALKHLTKGMKPTKLDNRRGQSVFKSLSLIKGE